MDGPPMEGEAGAVKGPSGSWTAVNFPALGMGYWEEHWARVANLYPFRQVPTFLWVRVAKRQEVSNSGAAAACDSPGAGRSRSRCTTMRVV